MEHLVSPKSTPQSLWFSDRYLGWETSALLFTHLHTSPGAVWEPHFLPQTPTVLAHCILISLPAQLQINLLAIPQSGHPHTKHPLNFIAPCEPPPHPSPHLWLSKHLLQDSASAYEFNMFFSVRCQLLIGGFNYISQPQKKRELLVPCTAPMWHSCVSGLSLVLTCFVLLFCLFPAAVFFTRALWDVLQTRCSWAPHSQWGETLFSRKEGWGTKNLRSESSSSGA